MRATQAGIPLHYIGVRQLIYPSFGSFLLRRKSRPGFELSWCGVRPRRRRSLDVVGATQPEALGRSRISGERIGWLRVVGRRRRHVACGFGEITYFGGTYRLAEGRWTSSAPRSLRLWGDHVFRGNVLVTPSLKRGLKPLGYRLLRCLRAVCKPHPQLQFGKK